MTEPGSKTSEFKAMIVVVLTVIGGAIEMIVNSDILNPNGMWARVASMALVVLSGLGYAKLRTDRKNSADKLAEKVPPT